MVGRTNSIEQFRLIADDIQSNVTQCPTDVCAVRGAPVRPHGGFVQVRRIRRHQLLVHRRRHLKQSIKNRVSNVFDNNKLAVAVHRQEGSFWGGAILQLVELREHLKVIGKFRE